jgi:hypothetical protein
MNALLITLWIPPLTTRLLAAQLRRLSMLSGPAPKAIT